MVLLTSISYKNVMGYIRAKFSGYQRLRYQLDLWILRPYMVYYFR